MTATRLWKQPTTKMKTLLSLLGLAALSLGCHAATLSSTNFAAWTNRLADADRVLAENTNRPSPYKTVTATVADLFTDRNATNLNTISGNPHTNGWQASGALVGYEWAVPSVGDVQRGFWDVALGANVWEYALGEWLFNVPLLSTSYVFPQGGYYSADGTAGETATTGGATFKNGLYTGGTITGGTNGTGGIDPNSGSGTNNTLYRLKVRSEPGNSGDALCVQDETGGTNWLKITTNGAVGFNTNNTLRSFQVVGRKPASTVTGSGGNAANSGAVYIAAGNGGDSLTNASSSGGLGGMLRIQSGDGGFPAGSTNVATGGAGGTVQFFAGSGASPTNGAFRRGGAGGNMSIEAGAGGTGTSTNGGAGGALILSGGAGGSSTGGNPGAPGAVSILGGSGGTGATNSNGGSVTITGGTPGSGASYGVVALQPSGGNVGIGTSTPGASLDVAIGEVRAPIVRSSTTFAGPQLNVTNGTGDSFALGINASGALVIDHDSAGNEAMLLRVRKCACLVR
jgi:hypothetical protein